MENQHVMNTIAQSGITLSRGGTNRRAGVIFTVLIFCAVVSIAFACSIGSVSLSPSDFLDAAHQLIHGGDAKLPTVLLQLRLTRALSGFATGAMLALAGVMMQALLRNPLADPYVLGVSGGAAVGALGALLLCSTPWMPDLASFVGAILVALLLFVLGHRDFRNGSTEGNTPTLLLTGVIISSGCGALVTLMLSIAPDNRLRGMVFWLIGDLSATQLRLMPWLVLTGASVLAIRMARAVNLIALYAEAAATFGVQVAKVRKGLFICAALLTASAVSSAGSIGFVGLIVPHFCRFLLGPDHRMLLPAATLVGGTFLVLADALARTVIAPQQLPVGVITALIGVPVFLMQLHHIRKR